MAPWPTEGDMRIVTFDENLVAQLRQDDLPVLQHPDGEGPFHGWPLEVTDILETPMGRPHGSCTRYDIHMRLKPPGEAT